MIGIFDSGLGGLTAVKEMHRISPGEKIIYFGDTGRVPYGTKSPETIIKYASQDASFLLSKGVDAILIACGTVSTTALSHLKNSLDIPIIGVVEPAAKAAVNATKNRKIGVIGTTATVKSGAFSAAIHAHDPSIEVISVACPLFVPLVENGFIQRDCEITRLTCKHYLKEIKDSSVDTLILGCTHFPIIADIISDVLPDVVLINTGAEAASAAASLLGIKQGVAQTEYYVSDDPKLFCSSASVFLGRDVTENVFSIDIEKY